MTFGATPKDSSGIPVSSVYIPNVGFIALQGVFNSTDGQGNTSAIVTMAPTTTASSALTSVAAATSSTQLLAANTSRKGYRVFNDGTAILYLAESGSASTTSYTVQVPANGLWESPATPTWQGAVFAIWSAASGNARITELS